MSTWVTVGDVDDVYEGTVPARTQAILDQLERRLAGQVPDISARIILDVGDASYLDPETLRDVLVEAACRRLRNPKGYSYESDGDYSYRRDDSTKPGAWFTDEELRQLRLPPSGKAGTCTVTMPVYPVDDPRWADEPAVVW